MSKPKIQLSYFLLLFILILIPTLTLAEKSVGQLDDSSRFYGNQSLNSLVDGDQMILTLPGGGVRVEIAGEESAYMVSDHLHSGRVTVTENNLISEQITYTPFGNTPSAGEGRYTGMAFEPETATYDYHARRYDPTIARFTGVDIARSSISPYTYTENNPVVYVDPTGQTRTGAVVSSRVQTLADKLVGKTSKFNSTTRFLSALEPTVKDFFINLIILQYSDHQNIYYDFIGKVARSKSPASKEGAFADLYTITSRLLFVDPKGSALETIDMPPVNTEQRDTIIEKLREFNRLTNEHRTFERKRSALLKKFKGDERAYYRSSKSMKVLKKSATSAFGLSKGYGNCGEISHCIGGQIAEIDPEVNVEVFGNVVLEHGFTVVGRDPKTDIHTPMSWNKEALIVDGWLGFTAPARDYYATGKNMEYFNPDHSIVRIFHFE